MKCLGWMLLVISGAMLAGCGGSSMDDLKEYAKQVRARKSGQIKPIPKITPYAPYTYNPKSERDPFKPLRLTPEGNNSNLHPDIHRAREPLEAFPMDGLRMVGTISQQGRMFALIRAPDGVIYRVTVGNHLGQNYGEITAITRSKVSIIELVPNGVGGWAKHPTALTLSND